MENEFAGGFLHDAKDDIQNLRSLLKEYGSAIGIVKELLQNAEDAGAGRFHLKGRDQ